MSISVESVKELLSSDNLGDRLRAVNQIRELEPKTGLELVQVAIRDKNSRVRYSAVSQMDTLGGQDLDLSLQILRELLTDPEADVQAAAADCLGALKLQAAFEDLQELYHQTPEWLVQFSIVATLGALGDPRGFELLKQALASDNGLVQTAAISSLGELGNPDAVPLLATYSTNSDWQVRYRVVQALGNLGGAEAKAILETLVNDEVEAVAKEAKRANYS
ncbi:phycobilisome degradation protein NblB [Sphaerospermopsis torques-reginae]|uniref:HEAT repeat domain-containing protein n=1 Tax=Sphaerospermopsis torques-reginae ITEP-024 TaxID=984208 RepID=A0ABX8X3R1_9CYAN|nr:HEAT repeat domain-containing protein [Sphaerospermopsis torques-reginae]QYX33254.1 HEAT repeat domain-containing protein [Sphaerospermopsis torques-reginae ITEP-024]